MYGKKQKSPRVTFEDVRAAATRLQAEGAKPTARAVRVALGDRGSLETIQRHMALLRKGRRARPHTPYTVTSNDLEELSPVDFAALINRLVRFENRRCFLNAHISDTLRIDDPDGGIDGVIAWDAGGPNPTTWLSRAALDGKPNRDPLGQQSAPCAANCRRRKVAPLNRAFDTFLNRTAHTCFFRRRHDGRSEGAVHRRNATGRAFTLAGA